MPFCRLLLVTALVAPLYATAAELTPFTGYSGGGRFSDAITGSTVEIADSPSYGVVVRFDDGRNRLRRVELLYSHQSTHLEAVDSVPRERLFDLDIDYLQLGGTYLIGSQSGVRPFISGGLGLTWMTPDLAGADDELFLSMSLGIGTDWFPSRSIGLRAELRGYGTMVDSATSLFCSGGGCLLQLSGSGTTQYQALAGVTVRF